MTSLPCNVTGAGRRASRPGSFRFATQESVR